MSDFDSVYQQISAKDIKMGDLKKLAKTIKKDHELAKQLWATKEYIPRLFATLIFDKTLLEQELIESLAADLAVQTYDEQNRVMEWLLANQMTKSKKTTNLMLSWQHHQLALLRRTFWYYQARLRWAGQTPPENNNLLLNAVEKDIAGEEPSVQWAMNFTAAWIGIYDEQYRERCINLGEQLGLYKEEVAPKGCTPNYLPEFIKIEVAKRS